MVLYCDVFVVCFCVEGFFVVCVLLVTELYVEGLWFVCVFFLELTGFP